MTECAYCKAETELYEKGTPVCVVCAGAKTVQPRLPVVDSQIHLKLLQDVRRATDRLNEASESFNAIIQDTPGAIPHPDGTLHITKASRELSTAREEVMRAHRRLNDFLSRGVIPEDLIPC
jgi:hypothetical protein